MPSKLTAEMLNEKWPDCADIQKDYLRRFWPHGLPMTPDTLARAFREVGGVFPQDAIIDLITAYYPRPDRLAFEHALDAMDVDCPSDDSGMVISCQKCPHHERCIAESHVPEAFIALILAREALGEEPIP